MRTFINATRNFFIFGNLKEITKTSRSKKFHRIRWHSLNKKESHVFSVVRTQWYKYLKILHTVRFVEIHNAGTIVITKII